MLMRKFSLTLLPMCSTLSLLISDQSGVFRDYFKRSLFIVKWQFIAVKLISFLTEK